MAFNFMVFSDPNLSIVVNFIFIVFFSRRQDPESFSQFSQFSCPHRHQPVCRQIICYRQNHYLHPPTRLFSFLSGLCNDVFLILPFDVRGSYIFPTLSSQPMLVRKRISCVDFRMLVGLDIKLRWNDPLAACHSCIWYHLYIVSVYFRFHNPEFFFISFPKFLHWLLNFSLNRLTGLHLDDNRVKQQGAFLFLPMTFCSVGSFFYLLAQVYQKTLLCHSKVQFCLTSSISLINFDFRGQPSSRLSTVVSINWCYIYSSL